MILFPDTDQVGARCAVGKIEEAVGEQVRHITPPVTLSVGVVTFHSVPVTVDRMLRESDRLMYQAKGQGKHRVFYLQVGP